MYLYPVTHLSDSSTVTATAANLECTSPSANYLFESSTNCWIRQGSAKLVTCSTNANMADGDYITITVAGVAVNYEYDKSANGVTSGRTSWAAGASTAANVAATLKTAINATQTTLVVTDNTDGTLTIVAPGQVMTIVEHVAHASTTVASTVVTTTAADGNMFVPALAQILLQGDLGPQVGVLRDSADGKATLTPVLVY